MKVIRSIPAVLVLMCSGTYAQQPRIVNANVQTRSAAGGLEREFRSLLSGQAEPAWLGYGAPMIPGEHNMCCYESAHCCSGCQLEGKQSGGIQSGKGERVRLEGPRYLFVLLRLSQH